MAAAHRGWPHDCDRDFSLGRPHQGRTRDALMGSTHGQRVWQAGPRFMRRDSWSFWDEGREHAARGSGPGARPVSLLSQWVREGSADVGERVHRMERRNVRALGAKLRLQVLSHGDRAADPVKRQHLLPEDGSEGLRVGR